MLGSGGVWIGLTASVVKSVTASLPIVSSGGTNPNLSLSLSLVTPGSYTSANITVDQYGIIQAAANGSGGGGTPGGSATQLQYNNSGSFGGVPASTVDAAQKFVGFQQAIPAAPVHITGATGATEPAPASLTVTDALDPVIPSPSGFVLSEEHGPVLPSSVTTTIVYIDGATGTITGNDFPNTPSTLIAAGQTWTYTIYNYRILGSDKVIDPVNISTGTVTDTLNDGSQVSVFITGWNPTGINSDGFILQRVDGSGVSPTSWIDIGMSFSFQDDGFLNQDTYFQSSLIANSSTRNTNISSQNTFNSTPFRSDFVTTPATDNGSGLYMAVETDFTLSGTDTPWYLFINGNYDQPPSNSVVYDWGQTGGSPDITSFSSAAFPNFNTALTGTNSTTMFFNYGSGSFIADGSSWYVETWEYRHNYADGVNYFVPSPDTSTPQSDDGSLSFFNLSGGWNPGDGDGAVILAYKNGVLVAGVDEPNPSVSYAGLDSGATPPAITPSIAGYAGITRTIDAYGFVTSPGLKYSSSFNTQSFTDSNTAPYFIKQVISGSGYTGVKVIDHQLTGAAKHVTSPNANGTFYETLLNNDAATGVTPSTIGFLGNGDTYNYKVWSVGSFGGTQVYSSTFVTGSITLPNDSNFYTITITPAAVSGATYKSQRIINAGSPVYDTFNGPSLQDDTTLVWGSTSTVTPTTAPVTALLAERAYSSSSISDPGITTFRNDYYSGSGVVFGFNDFRYMVSPTADASMGKYGVNTDGNFFIDSLNHGLNLGSFSSPVFSFNGSGSSDSVFNLQGASNWKLRIRGSSATYLTYWDSSHDTIIFGGNSLVSGAGGFLVGMRAVGNAAALQLEPNGTTASQPLMMVKNTSGTILMGVNQLGQGYFNSNSEASSILHLGPAKSSQTQLLLDDNSVAGSIPGGIFRQDINNSYGPLTYTDVNSHNRPIVIEPFGGWTASSWIFGDASGHITSDTTLTKVGSSILAVNSAVVLEAKGGIQVDSGKDLNMGNTSKYIGPFIPGYRAVTTSLTISASDYTINVTANTVTITLNTAVGFAGRVVIIHNSGSGTVTINTTSAQTIDGAASGSITLAQFHSRTVQSDGANWIVLSVV